MLLNADIVFDNLPGALKARMMGPKSMELALKRPELYIGGEAPFEANRLYLVSAERIPRQARAERGCVIVSIGDSPLIERYRKRCCVIEVDREADFYRTFNALQNIFDRYDDWEAELHGIVAANGSIEELLTCSESVFENPLYAIDESFRVLGVSRRAETFADSPSVGPGGGSSLRLDAFDQFLAVTVIAHGLDQPRQGGCQETEINLQEGTNGNRC